MKLLDFSIEEDFTTLRQGTASFDLHNDFKFAALAYDSAARTIEMNWQRGVGNWIRPGTAPALRLAFKGVHLFKAHQRDPELPFTEDGSMNLMGFIWDDMLEVMDGVTTSAPKDGCTHFIAVFVSEFCVKIGAESVSLQVDDDLPAT